MWGGGRPDDITVIVSRIIDTNREKLPATFKAFTGPGQPPEELLAPRPPGGPIAHAAAEKAAVEDKGHLPEW